ncbi:MAG: ComF family protein [Clostridia bacterium]|nr:ComF family protein [Clostridia bacterium]
MAERNRILNYLRDLCFPPRCVACCELLDWKAPAEDRASQDALCNRCLREWVSETLETCGICAKRVGDCFCQPFPMSAAKSDGLCKLTYYLPQKKTPVQNRMIYSVKQKNDCKTVHFLAEALAPMLTARLSELGLTDSEVVITHLPRARSAVLFHGVDQAKALALGLSAMLGVSHSTLIVRRRGADRVQKALSVTEREKNAKHAFLPAKNVECRGKTVLLVDDIVTTGAGMAACTRILRKMGAAHVIAVAIASDVKNKDVIEFRSPKA